MLGGRDVTAPLLQLAIRCKAFLQLGHQLRLRSGDKAQHFQHETGELALVHQRLRLLEGSEIARAVLGDDLG